MKSAKLISSALAMLFCFLSFAQQKTITGVVSDTTGPLPGAVVTVKGTTRTTQTDLDGKYTIKASEGENLVFHFIGMQSQMVKVGKSTVINVVLKDESTKLEEVVIDGYRAPSRKTMSAVAQTTVTAQTIEIRPDRKTRKALQGKVAGLTISTSSGQANNIAIRGVQSNYTLSTSAETAKKGSYQTLSKKERRKLKEAQNQAVPVIEPDDEDYGSFVENAFESPKNAALSTFSIDVDNASYTNVRRFINNGQTVPKDAVRVEEMMNFFHYQYPQPQNEHPFSINTEYSDCAWNSGSKLIRIGLQGKNIESGNLPASNLVFLIDVSGSMNMVNKLPLVKESLKALTAQLRKEDMISIVVYAGAAGLVLPPTPGDKKMTIIDALDKLEAGGSTAGGAGIQLAYKTAEEHFIKGGNNRVILATDGDFNVGASSDSDMQTLIEEKRKTGVFLTCLGYGMGNYKDSKLETLADKGNGNYAYIDSIQEANRFLVKEFKGSMFAIAKDVKIQIEFNPAHVKAYRLIGYENRKLRPEDFVNDAIDAGELGSGHTVTALYEIIPADSKSEFYAEPANLKYTKTTTETKFNDELATIKFRYKKPDGDKSIEMVQVIENKTVAEPSADFKFCSAVAWFGLKLRDSKLISNKSPEDIKKLAKQGLANDDEGYKAEFIRLIEGSKTIAKL